MKGFEQLGQMGGIKPTAAPHPGIRLPHAVVEIAMVYHEEEEAVFGGEPCSQLSERGLYLCQCGRQPHVALTVVVEVCRRRGESAAVGKEHVAAWGASITHQQCDVLFWEMQVLTESAVEKGTVVPVALVVHQLVHSTVDDDGMNTPRGLLCAGGATEDHDAYGCEQARVQPCSLELCRAGADSTKEQYRIQNGLCSFYDDLLSIDNIDSLLQYGRLVHTDLAALQVVDGRISHGAFVGLDLRHGHCDVAHVLSDE